MNTDVENISVRILFFGATADLAGQRAIELTLGDSATVSEALSTITNSNNGFLNHRLLVALNQEYVSIDTHLKDGDELAIFTPVSGG